MYLLDVKAIVPEGQYVAAREPHSIWVKKGFDKGWFLFAGPKKNELGGFILVKDIERSELDTFIEEDPFVIDNLAQYEVTSFSVSLTADMLKSLKR